MDHNNSMDVLTKLWAPLTDGVLLQVLKLLDHGWSLVVFVDLPWLGLNQRRDHQVKIELALL